MDTSPFGVAVTEEAIQALMVETGMDYLQARRHLQQREALKRMPVPDRFTSLSGTRMGVDSTPPVCFNRILEIANRSPE